MAVLLSWHVFCQLLQLRALLELLIKRSRARFFLLDLGKVSNRVWLSYDFILARPSVQITPGLIAITTCCDINVL